jgi:hypothetical protein
MLLQSTFETESSIAEFAIERHHIKHSFGRYLYINSDTDVKSDFGKGWWASPSQRFTLGTELIRLIRLRQGETAV